MNEKIRRVGISLRPSTPELREVFYEAKALFEAHNIEVTIDNISGSMIGVMGQPFETMCQNCDILATIGGDGTLISAVRRSYRHDIPVMGIHAGKLGFLADIALDELDDVLNSLHSGEFNIDERAMLEAIITTSTGVKKVVAFNDLVITRPSISKMIHIEAFVDGKEFNTYFGDGVIISTPTGSTAYNLSAGGPVLFPLTRVFALTPICPHSLTQRPVVLPGHYKIEIRTPDESALAVIDGQDIYKFGKGDSIDIHLADYPAKLLHRKTFNYFDVLKEKLNWGD